MRHWRLALALSVAAAGLALWLAFPRTVARLAADRLGSALGTRVQIASIRWHPLRGRWTVANLRIAAERGAPALVARRIETHIHLWDLLNGRYRVRTATAKGMRVRLRATPSGWQVPLPSHAPEPAAALPTVLLDWVSAPRAVILLEPAADVRSIVRARQLEAMATLEPDRTQAILWTKGRLDRGSIALVARVRTTAGAHRLRLRIAAENMDVARVLRLASDASVRDVRGRVTVRGKYDEYGTGGDARRTASGSLRGEDIALGTRGVDAVWTRGVAFSRFAVDLDRRQLALGAVRLDQPEAWVRRTAAGFALPGGSAPSKPAAGGDGPAWTFRIDAIDVGGGAVHVADVERKQQVDLRIVKAHTGPVAGTREPIAAAVEVTLDTGGRASVSGEVVREPLGARLRLDLEGLALPPLTRFADAPLGLESGRIAGSLDLHLAESDVAISGSLHAQDLKSVSPDSARPEDVLAFKDMRVDIRRVRTDPYSIELARVELEWPYVLVDRTPTGVFPWTLVAARSTEETSSPARPLPSIRLDRLAVMGGRIDFRDATLDPPYWRSLATFKSTAEAIDAPPLRIASLRATALVDELSPLTVHGTIGERTHLAAGVQKLALSPFNAYLQGAAPYTVASGTISAQSEIVLERSELEVQNRVVLSRLGLKGTTGDDFIQREVGVPLTLALALMKDYRGNIELGLPFGGNLTEPTFSMRSVVLQAIVRAVRGAVMSPLNALGRVILRDGRIEQFDLEPIPFAAGARTLDAAGQARIQQIARVLEAHPNLVLRVRGQVAQVDADSLRGEAALAALAEDRAFEQLRAVVQARLAGGPPPAVRPEDGRRLENLLATLPWPTEALHRLAVDRGAVAAASFIVDHKIDPGRVAAEPPKEPRPETLATAPNATVELRQR